MWPSFNETKSMWPSVGNKQGWNAKVVHPEHIYEARKGEKARQIAELNVDRRRTMEAEITSRAVEFIKRNANAGKPFYAYIPFSLVHMPTLPNPEFAGKTGNGDWADCLAEMDYRTGQILDAIKEAGIEDNTLVIFASDNGPEATDPWQGDNGPWRGTYFTAMEGRYARRSSSAGRAKCPRVALITRSFTSWTCYTTLARVGGAEVPKDRPIDGVDQLDFFLGKQELQPRRLSCLRGRPAVRRQMAELESAPDLAGKHVRHAAKLPLPKVINLLTDLKEERDVAAKASWVADPVVRIIGEFEASLKKYPPIKSARPTRTCHRNRRTGPYEGVKSRLNQADFLVGSRSKFLIYKFSAESASTASRQAILAKLLKIRVGIAPNPPGDANKNK